jgi:peptide-methionine (S)-S-oxide reductase
MKSVLLIYALAISLSTCSKSTVPIAQKSEATQQPDVSKDGTLVLQEGDSTAIFASGCFWCVEAIFESVKGVKEVYSGYAGGSADDANYESVGSGITNHAEAVLIIYDSKVVDYNTLLDVFFGSHDATTLNRQGPDAGRQYRSTIFYKNETEKIKAQNFIASLYASNQYKPGSITTTLESHAEFYMAEGYHQNYEKNNPNNPYVKSVSIPRLNRFKTKYPQLLK